MSHDFDDQGILLCVSFFHTHTTLTAILIWHDMAGVSYKKAVVYKLMTLLVKRKQTWNSLMIRPFGLFASVIYFSFPFVTVICNAIK